MFLFTLDRALLKFTLNTPAPAPLFQFPPRFAHRLHNYWPIPDNGVI